MIPLKNHPRREQLIAFMGGHLNDAEREALAHHIEECDACCHLLRDMPEDALLVRLRDGNTPTNAGDEAAVPARRDHALPMELIDHPRYKIGRFLGSGGMGAVYQAEHRLMDRVVALKIIHRDLIQHPRVIERFRLEVKAAARLSHPNIVTAYDAEQAGDAHFLVMEFVDGISLAQLVSKKGALEIATACNFARQAAKGLQHAFEAGMVHRDIKPHNLMLTRKGQIKILDFGLARMASETRPDLRLPSGTAHPGLTRTGEIMGTPDYMAPEQFIDPSRADIRADLYSLASTLYYLLTGRTPLADYPVPSLLNARKYRSPRPITELRGDLPVNLVSALNKLLAKDPAQRYATPAEVVKTLGPFVKSVPATQRPASEKPALVATSADDTPQGSFAGFLAQCPFCTARIKIPDRALGASLPCPHCHSYFTAVPADEETRKS